jgi:hypothetical protein
VLTRRPIAIYDRVYRYWCGLDTPRASVPPILLVQVHRSHRSLALADRSEVRRGDRVGTLHLNNERVAALHAGRPTPTALGLEFRRQFLASLHALAVLCGPAGRLAEVRAFTAVTIFHHSLTRVGFEIEPNGLAWPRCVGGYQRALLTSLHPSGQSRLAHLSSGRAERCWISRGRLLALYSSPARRAG